MSHQLSPDRLSDLPDHILHQIMFFLSGKDAAKMAALSTRFRSAWIVFPVIDVEGSILRNRLVDVVESSLRRLRARKIFGLNKFRINFESIMKQQLDPLRAIVDSVMDQSDAMEELDLHVSCCYVPQLFQNSGFLFRLPSSFRSIKVLKLTGIDQLNPETPKLIISYPSLQVLSLSDCLGPNELVLSCENLKTLQLENDRALQVDIAAPNLEYFYLKQVSLPQSQLIEMSSCKSLKTLILETSIVSEEWLATHLSNFSLLEILRLKHCHSLTNILVSIASLKSFTLDNCNSMKKIKIIAESLNSFVCKVNNWSPCENIDIEAKSLRYLEIEISTNRQIPLFVVHSPIISCETKLILILHRQVFDEVGFWFKALRDFLVSFGHCKVLTLVCNNAKGLSFPEELRDDMVPPLLDMNHLKVDISSPDHMMIPLHPVSPFDQEKLVDSLLWSCPHAESITIKYKGQKEKILEFTYAETHGRGDALDFLPVNCWKNCLKEVKMKYFNDAEFRIMRQFFERNAVRFRDNLQRQKGATCTYRRL